MLSDSSAAQFNKNKQACCRRTFPHHLLHQPVVSWNFFQKGYRPVVEVDFAAEMVDSVAYEDVWCMEDHVVSDSLIKYFLSYGYCGGLVFDNHEWISMAVKDNRVAPA